MSSSNGRDRIVRAGLLVLLLGPAVALAQDNPYNLSLDMQLPAVSAAHFPEMLAPAVNPAGVTLDSELAVMFLHQQNLQVEPGGEGRPASAGAEGLFVKSGKVGLAVQWLRPLEHNDRLDYLKFSLSLPLVSYGKVFGLAASLELLDPTNTAASSSVDFAVGALFRPFRFLSLGAVGRNLGKATLNGWRQPRLLDLALAVRPLWFAPERLTLAVDWRVVQDFDDPALRFATWVTIVPGISLFGSADLDGNFGAGLAVDFTRLGGTGYVGVNNTTAGLEAGYLVVGASAWGSNRPGLQLSGGRTAVIVLDSSLVAEPPPVRGLLSRRLPAWKVEMALARARRDSRVDSVLIRVEDPELSWSLVEDLRAQIRSLRQAGKKVVVHLRDADNLSYYLACAADTVLINPGGGFAVTGPMVEALFLGGTMQLLGARAEYRRVGDFKTAVDTLTREEPSQAHQQVLQSLADEADRNFVTAVAEGRNLEPGRVRQLLEKGLMTPQQAQQAGMVDKLVPPDAIEQELGQSLGHRATLLNNYLRQRWSDDRWGRLPQIAVVHATGTIGYRGTLLGGMNAHAIADILERLRDDDDVAAVVLRIDSPGGSGAASDLIWRQVVRLRERKPVVVSMGKVAASGGYYIAAPADAIVAEPSTITGSIGVFALFLDLSDLWAALGVSKEIVKRSSLADIDSTFRARSEAELELIGRNVEAFYRHFIELVAQGRHRRPEEIDKVGRGRVWTGSQARERGLVDELGGLSRALEIARQRAGLGAGEPVEVVHLPRPRLSLRSLLSELGIIESLDAGVLELLRGNMRTAAQLLSLGKAVPLLVTPLLVTIH